jgi:glucosamine kinase
MKLIADGGSTKCSWCLLDAARPRTHFSTEGYNPYFFDTAAIAASLSRALPGSFPGAEVREVHYYGSGVLSPAKAEVVAGALRQVFPRAAVHVAEDLLAAARALLGHEPGFAAILGTGTNSCLYDGQRITHNVESLGYSLGDEGSGTYIGRQLLRDYLRGRLPGSLAASFTTAYGLGPISEVLDQLYNQPLPNRFLAGFAKFAADYYHEPYCRAVVAQAFDAFFEQIVTHYPGYQRYSFNCVGSVGYHFREALAQAASRHGMAEGQIIQAPIDALVGYHEKEAS